MSETAKKENDMYITNVLHLLQVVIIFFQNGKIEFPLIIAEKLKKRITI